MYVLNLHFDPLLDYNQSNYEYREIGGLIDALRFVYPWITWNGGEEIDSNMSKEDLSYSKSVLVMVDEDGDFKLLKSLERYIKEGEFEAPKPINGRNWIHEVLLKKRNEADDFGATTDLFNQLNESISDECLFLNGDRVEVNWGPNRRELDYPNKGVVVETIGQGKYKNILVQIEGFFRGHDGGGHYEECSINNCWFFGCNEVTLEVDYDDTTDLFNQLNESEMEERFKSHPLLFSGVVIQPSDGIEGIRTALKLFDNVGVPTREGAKWDQADIEFVYEDYLLKNEPVFIGVDYSNRTQGEGLYLAWGSPNFFRKKYSESGLKYKIYTLPEFVSLLEGVDFGYSNFFGDLNESKYQPKLNLRFDNPIMYDYELDKVLKVLSDRYPDLRWAGEYPVLAHNPIRENSEDFEYDPIYYLTIGFFPSRPDKLTYTSGSIDDESYADHEHHMYYSIDGWQWVKDNEVDYDETTNLFNQLNESEEDDLDWARQVVNDVVLGKEGINVGDVFYIVDSGPGTYNVRPDDYKPRDVRYIITITNITEEPFEGEDIKVKYEACDPQDVTYNPKDYSIEKPRCYDYHDDDEELASGLAWVLDLVKKKYWRPMGSSL